MKPALIFPFSMLEEISHDLWREALIELWCFHHIHLVGKICLYSVNQMMILAPKMNIFRLQLVIKRPRTRALQKKATMRTLETCSANPGLRPGECFERYQILRKYCWEPQQSINFTEINHLACISLPKSFFYGHKLGKCSWPQRVKSAASTAKLVIHAKHGCAWRRRLLARSLQVCFCVPR